MSYSEEEIEEIEEESEESTGEGEVEAGEEAEEIAFTLDQINLMIQATEIWDQLLRGSTSIEEAKKILDRGRSISVPQEKILSTTEEEEIKTEKKISGKRKRSRSKKFK